MKNEKPGNPLVSIIIPTHNRAEYLSRAVKSCINQTYKNSEIIVVDDNSGDNTAEVVKGFRGNRIRYFRNKSNKGAPYSRNKGLSVARGMYINFLDDDDELLPDKTMLQMEKFRTSDISSLGVVTCDVEYRRQDLRKVINNRKRGSIYIDLLRGYCVFGIQTMLIKKEFLEMINGFDESLPSNQEYDLQLRLSRFCSYDYVPELLAVTHESDGQISFNFRKKIKGVNMIFSKYKAEYRKQGLFFFFTVYAYMMVNLFLYYIGLLFGKRAYSWLKKLVNLVRLMPSGLNKKRIRSG
ncbi:MAG: hypothetical protein A2W23_07335 [Planctomycetes bacterium RBG_16_43_13]|nr:MAG: hypothetical protein A2W23_07335 [Planctomycetes bacterium RBG_16_43_13]